MTHRGGETFTRSIHSARGRVEGSGAELIVRGV